MNNDKEKHTFLREDGSIAWGKLVFRTFIALLFIFVIFIIYDKVIRSSVQTSTLAQDLYNKLGHFGVSLFVYLCDTFIVPLTPDIMFPLVSSNWNILEITLFMGSASFLGGISAYWLGHLLSKIKIVDKYANKIMGSHKVFIHNKGAWGVALAGLTPIPYSTICWTAGILKVEFKKVIFACLVRFPRMILYYYLFIAGAQITNFL
ncbi:MAG: YqaA family protein [Pleomorphochaeta sp.]|nr:VTT domain-containing protein [Sphaerochaetaceae bacterium]